MKHKKGKKREKKNSIAVCTKLRGETTTMDDRVAVALTTQAAISETQPQPKKYQPQPGFKSLLASSISTHARTHSSLIVRRWNLWVF